ncbi:PhoX family protein [Brevibacillus ginsengisoli]|uniref:PhoX family protein n=1 Tax=Brevibacillus ginsengisoli TaxID=363854 RepID=UPI003CE97E19
MKKLVGPILSLSLLLPVVAPVTVQADSTQQVPESARGSIKSVQFIGMEAPSTVEERTQAYSKAQVEVTYSNGMKKSIPLSYNTLYKSTDEIGGMNPGLAIDVNGKPIMDTSVPGKTTPFISDDPDSNDLLQVKGAPATGKGGNPLYLVTHYEYITKDASGGSAYGIVPASMSLTTVDQNKKTGELSPVKVKKIDFSGVDGLWIPCNGSQSPWNTHLGSEEYEPDARAYEADPTKTYVGPFTKSYFGTNKPGNPYHYGFLPEVTVKPDGSTKVAKHYSMGRISRELVKVMPDERTTYMGDDGSSTMMFMYIADKAKDLSAGTLYAAKWIQTSDKDGGAANLNWIKLGHATDAEVKEYADKLKFSDLFETADKDTPGFTKIKTYPSGKDEWLKVKPGMEKAAAFLESRRYGAIMGATSEFNKMEGVTLNAKDKKLYIAMSYLSGAMQADDKAPTDDIKLPKINAGVTFEVSLTNKQKDSKGKKIDSDYVASSMNGLIVGEDMSAPDAVGNTAVVDKIANPDNLSFSEKTRTLFIGEDSGMHVNNFMWAYNVDTKKLSRILSLPAGAESTGLQAVDNMNGFMYVMSNAQHPGDLEEMKTIPADLKAQLAAKIDSKAGVVGYISGIPAIK